MSSKTGREAKAERMTWFSMIMVFILVSFDSEGVVPPFMIPIALATILVLSGFYQYSKKWRVSPLLWIVAAVMGLIGGYGAYDPSIPIDPALVGFIGTLVVILFGVLTNEG